MGDYFIAVQINKEDISFFLKMIRCKTALPFYVFWLFEKAAETQNLRNSALPSELSSREPAK